MSDESTERLRIEAQLWGSRAMKLDESAGDPIAREGCQRLAELLIWAATEIEWLELQIEGKMPPRPLSRRNRERAP